jgi:hypothetical protein
MNILKQINQENQLPAELKETFIELKVLKHLRQAGIKRNLGFACSYLFQIVFCLLFQHHNWFRMQESERKNVKMQYTGFLTVQILLGNVFYLLSVATLLKN